jgi:hypothetical protein
MRLIEAASSSACWEKSRMSSEMLPQQAASCAACDMHRSDEGMLSIAAACQNVTLRAASAQPTKFVNV